MKWKLYQLCSLFNVLIIILYLVLFFFFLIKEGGGMDLSIFLFLIGSGIVLAKNMMGYKLHARLHDTEIHSPGNGVIFYLLWIFNIVIYVFIFIFVIGDLSIENMQRIAERPLSDILLIISIYLATLTLAYTLIFDIPIERKIRKQRDIAAELLMNSND